jgi:hypothetical protein
MRPRFLSCPMTPEIIRAIKANQEYYDSDPQAYEEMEKLRIENELQENARAYEEMERQRYEESRGAEEQIDLPF